MWIFLCFFLIACNENKIDFHAEKITGINAKKVGKILHQYNNCNSENKLEVEYEILESPLIIDVSHNSTFDNLIIAISVKHSGVGKVKTGIVNYQHYGIDKWQYNDVILDVIARKIVDLELMIQNDIAKDFSKENEKKSFEKK